MPFVAMPSIDLGDRPPGSWVVYVLTDPRDSLVRYVGFTRHGLPGRLAKHLAQPTNEAMREWISELASTRMVPAAVALEYVSNHRAEWQHAERSWIAWFRERGDLLNVQAGGDVTLSRARPADKTFPLAAGDLPTNRRNPYGRFGLWNPDIDTWFKMNKASRSAVRRGKLDPRFPHPSMCPCRKCALQDGAK